MGNKQIIARSTLGRVGLITMLAMSPAIAAAQEPPLTDPTRPNWYGLKAKVTKAANALELNSIIISAHRRLAVINGELMREGEERKGLLLKEVLKDRVLVQTPNDGLKALRLSLPSLRKKAS